MANDVEPQVSENQPPPKKSGSGKGCMWGCLIVGGLFFAVVLVASVGGYFFVSNQVAKYTSETPVELPTVDFSEQQLAELDTRVQSFREKLDAGETPAEDLVLTADEINAMIEKNEDLKGKIYVKIENGQVKGDVSFPLDDLPLGKGRYFNGSATFDVSMEGGVLIVTADQAELNGEPVPENFMEALRQENLAKDAYKDADNARFMRQFEDIRIEDDKFVLRVKRGSAEANAEANDEASDDSASDDEASDDESNAAEISSDNVNEDAAGSTSAEVELSPAGK